MEDDVVIKAEGLWKRYGIPPEKNLPTYLASLGYNFLLGKSLRRWSKDDSGIWALRDVSFEVKRGEAFGIIGRNGSGKSTLLKILAGTSPPTFGKITVKGRVFSMIELSAGMNPELSGRENVRLLATVMGFSPRWIARKLPEIEDFCELEEWFDRPVWQYSSGMMARLGFAVAINVDADVLLIDEVMAVGDLAFQRKSYEWFEKNTNNKTIVVVSHSLAQIARICNKTIVLDKGEQLFYGEASKGITVYEDLVRTEIQSKISAHGNNKTFQISYDFGEVSLLSAELFSNNEKVDVINSGDPIDIIINIKVHQSFPEIRITVVIEDIRNIGIVWFRPIISQAEIGEYSIHIKVPELWLTKGQYFMRIGGTVGTIKKRSFNIQNVLSFYVIQESMLDVEYSGYYSPPYSCSISINNSFDGNLNNLGG